MGSLTGNHMIELLCLLTENFKKLPFVLSIIGRSFENLSYLSSCSFSQRWRFWRIRSNLLRGIGYLAFTKVSGVASQYILLPGSLWYPVRSSMLKNQQIFSLVISKSIPAFSAVQLDVAKNQYQLISHKE